MPTPRKITDELAHQIADWMQENEQGIIQAGKHFGFGRTSLSYHLKRIGRKEGLKVKPKPKIERPDPGFNKTSQHYLTTMRVTQ